MPQLCFSIYVTHGAHIANKLPMCCPPYDTFCPCRAHYIMLPGLLTLSLTLKPYRFCTRLFYVAFEIKWINLKNLNSIPFPVVVMNVLRNNYFYITVNDMDYMVAHKLNVA